jgi:hypothetical protein
MNDLPSNEQYFRIPYPAIQIREQMNCPADDGAGHCDTETEWRQLSPRSSGVNEFIGPELECGRALYDLEQKPFNIIKCATNGTSLANNWNPAAVSGELLFARMVAYVRAVGTGPVAAIVWVQGEGDTGNATLANAYQANLANFINACRREMGEALVFAFNQLHVDAYSDNPTRAPQVPIVRAGQLAVSRSTDRCIMLNPDTLALKTDHLHYTTSAFLAMGAMFAAILIAAGALG